MFSENFMSKTCKNCDHVVDGYYCSNCGQSVKVGKLNFTYLLEEFQHSIIHADKGILYTIKKLFFNPGDTINNYLAGKRTRLFKPFGFLIILATINGFLSHVLNITYVVDYSDFFELDANTSHQIKSDSLVIYDWLYNHYSLLSLISIIPLSLCSLIIFRRFGYGYVEHLAINAYSLGMQCLVSILFTPLWLLMPQNTYAEITFFFSFLYFVWIYTKMFISDGVFKAIIKSLLLYVFYLIGLLIIGVVGGVFWSLFLLFSS